MGRGTVVDEDALIGALATAGSASRRWTSSQPSRCRGDSPLWDQPNVLVSPHTAALNVAEDRLIAELFAANATRCWTARNW